MEVTGWPDITASNRAYDHRFICVLWVWDVKKGHLNSKSIALGTYLYTCFTGSESRVLRYAGIQCVTLLSQRDEYSS